MVLRKTKAKNNKILYILEKHNWKTVIKVWRKNFSDMTPGQ